MSVSTADVRSLYPPAGFVFGLKVRYRARVMDTERVLAHVPPVGNVLDIGCGTGLVLSELSLRGHDGGLVGLDVSEAALSLAREAATELGKRGANPPRYQISASPDDWPEGPFDTVCLVDVMHHVPDALKHDFLKAALSRVGPGGTFVYKDMAMSPSWCAEANRLHDRLLSGDRISYLPLSAARDAVTKSGMSVVAEDRWRQLWYAHECFVSRRGGQPS